MLEVITYRKTEPVRSGTAWEEIEVRSNGRKTLIYSWLVVNNGCGWAIDPATVEKHPSLEAAAAAFGYEKFVGFEEFNREEYGD